MIPPGRAAATAASRAWPGNEPVANSPVRKIERAQNLKARATRAPQPASCIRSAARSIGGASRRLGLRPGERVAVAFAGGEGKG